MSLWAHESKWLWTHGLISLRECSSIPYFISDSDAYLEMGQCPLSLSQTRHLEYVHIGEATLLIGDLIILSLNPDINVLACWKHAFKKLRHYLAHCFYSTIAINLCSYRYMFSFMTLLPYLWHLLNHHKASLQVVSNIIPPLRSHIFRSE